MGYLFLIGMQKPPKDSKIVSSNDSLQKCNEKLDKRGTSHKSLKDYVTTTTSLCSPLPECLQSTNSLSGLPFHSKEADHKQKLAKLVALQIPLKEGPISLSSGLLKLVFPIKSQGKKLKLMENFAKF